MKKLIIAESIKYDYHGISGRHWYEVISEHLDLNIDRVDQQGRDYRCTVVWSDHDITGRTFLMVESDPERSEWLKACDEDEQPEEIDHN